MTYPIPANDAQRVAYLERLALLDTAPNENLDSIVALCRDIFQVSVATVSLVASDRQWFMSMQGLDVCETEREVAFCNYTILQPDIFEVTDSLADERFRDNPLVTGPPHIRYYAGAALTLDGMALGSLCLIDFEPRPALTPTERTILLRLAAMVIREFRVQRLVRQAAAQLVQVD